MTYIKNFGNRPTPGATIQGIVFKDLNADGVQQLASGEVGLPGIVVEVDETAGGALVGTATTNAGGGYTIAVDASHVNRLLTTKQQTPVQNGWECTSPSNCTHAPEYVASGGTYTKNFGERPIVTSNPATIHGFVFLDTDEDGVKDAGETGIPGQTVEVVDLTPTFELIGSATSAADGSYTITVPAAKTGQDLQTRQSTHRAGDTYTLPVNWTHAPEYVASGGDYTKSFGNNVVGVAPDITSFTVSGDTTLSESGIVVATATATWAGTAGTPGAMCTLSRNVPPSTGSMFTTNPFPFSNLTHTLTMTFSAAELLPVGSGGYANLSFKLTCDNRPGNGTGVDSMDATATFGRQAGSNQSNQSSNQTSNQTTNQGSGTNEVTTFCAAD